jgi:hypothetical protein
VQEIEHRVEQRLRELAPAVEEYHRLRALQGRFDQAPGLSDAADVSGRRSGRQETRAEQVVSLVSTHPGITIATLAARLGLASPNYLYRVLPRLERQGRLRRDGRGWHLADQDSDDR